jgi:ketosteroid isomerase-like protein
MKKFILLMISCSLYGATSMAQTSDEAVKKTINRLFDAMRNSDSVEILSIFTPDAIMQSIMNDKEGKTSLRKNQVQQFASAIGKMAKGAADEQIEFETIKLDGELAFAWTPYRFILNGKYSHSGVDAFCLVKLNGEWKIQYLIDTRRK